jgi:hypothetical protein
MLCLKQSTITNTIIHTNNDINSLTNLMKTQFNLNSNNTKNKINKNSNKDIIPIYLNKPDNTYPSKMHKLCSVYLIVIQDWLKSNNIGVTIEKRNYISKDIFWAVFDTNLIIEDINYIIEYINKNTFVFNEGNIWKNITTYFKNDKYHKFFKQIFNLTPVGLNTSPNACCGKGELLYRLLRPNSRQPNKGDIIDDGVKKEIKGGIVRISSDNITGKNYRQITYTIFNTIIQGNIVKSGGLNGTVNYEIEKKQYESYYNNEFNKLEYNVMVALFEKLLIQLEINGDCNALSKTICENGYKQSTYQKIMLYDWFNKYKKRMDFDDLIIFGDGTNVKIIKDITEMNKINIVNDYFRINQTSNIGWYIE